MTNRSMFIILNVATLLSLLFCNTGCVSGPKSPDQTIAQKLNADSYESSNTLMGVPVLTRKTSPRKISGKLLCGEGLSQRPASHATVILNQGDKIIASTSSEADGTYTILASVLIEKSYQLKAFAKCGSTLKEISLTEDSRFDLILKN